MKRLVLISTAFVFLMASMWLSCKKDEKSNTDPDAPEEWPDSSIRIVKTGLNFPWEILWGKDDHIWMTERGGKISKVDPKTGDIVFSTTIPEVSALGEGGLLGMVQHPDFLIYGYIYVVYNYLSGTVYREKVVRFTFANNALQNPLPIIDNIAAAGAHNGSRLWISEDPSPYLFITTGDATNQRLPQDTNSLNGKVLRLSLDGSIPPDNPIPGNPLWSMGHRNPQGLVVINGTMYTSEHGPNIEDEVNIIEKGRNFGWPSTNGPCDGNEMTFCSTFNVKQPIWSSGGNTVAACGLDYYDKDLIPQWKNSLILATLKNARLYQLKLSDDKQTVVSVKEYFRNKWGRLRDLCISPTGRVYLCTSNGNNGDRLIEISLPE